MIRSHSRRIRFLIVFIIPCLACETGMEPYRIDPGLVGVWELYSVSVGYLSDYGKPMSVEEFGTDIHLTLEGDADFKIAYIHPDREFLHDGKWSTSEHRLRMKFSNGGEQSGKYSIQGDRFFTYGVDVLVGNVSHPQFEVTQYASLLYEFVRVGSDGSQRQRSQDIRDGFPPPVRHRCIGKRVLASNR